MKVGRKPTAATRNLFLLKRKLFRQPTAAMIFFEEYKLASSDDDFEKIKLAHGNKNEHIEEVMNQKGVKLCLLISKPLSDEERNKINQIIKNKDAGPREIYRH